MVTTMAVTPKNLVFRIFSAGRKFNFVEPSDDSMFVIEKTDIFFNPIFGNFPLRRRSAVDGEAKTRKYAKPNGGILDQSTHFEQPLGLAVSGAPIKRQECRFYER
jgi:hypothetical protein